MPGNSRAKEKAEAIRHQLSLGDAYVDVFDVMRRLGIEVYRKPFDEGLEGSLTVRDGVSFVFVNSLGSLTRQRLTAAHELGHYVLEEHREGTEILEASTSGGDGAGEWEVFRFARYFLMDEGGVGRLVAGIGDDRHKVAAVAHAFVTSAVVTAIHLRELGLISAAAKKQLKDEFDSGALKPAAFLARYGFSMGDMGQQVVELAPSHIKRALGMYAARKLSIAALAEVLQMTDQEARNYVVEAGIATYEEVDPIDSAAEGELVGSDERR